MDIQNNVSLANYTSFGVGGPAEKFVDLYSATGVVELPQDLVHDATILGYGANVLISDQGLPGLTVAINDNPDQLLFDDDGTVTVDAGHNWDQLVAESVEQGWWGLELTSGIPGGVGAAVVGNIAAYGQAVADSLQSVEVIDRDTGQPVTLQADELELGYRSSNLQTSNKNLIVISAKFKLTRQPQTELTYQSALDVAKELGLKPTNLPARRQIIWEARRRAGSLLGPDIKTAGSFFRNPIVTHEQAEQIIAHDESGKSAEQIRRMNQAHGGDSRRVSAAHVLLAAGFTRGQSWGPVRLHPDHVLKIENTGDATAQDIKSVADEIVATAQSKLGVTLTPEVRYLGQFG